MSKDQINPANQTSVEPELAESDSNYFDFDTLENPRQAAYLKAYSHWGTQIRAAAESSVDPMHHWRWMKSDANYRTAFAIAAKMADEADLDAVRDRARNIAKPSDLLLMFKVKAKHPEYKDNFQINVDNRQLTINSDKSAFDFEQYKQLASKHQTSFDKH